MTDQTDQRDASAKLWGGRFEKETDRFADEFLASIEFDRRLYREDIACSIAHARMLGAQGIIAPDEADRLIAGLVAIRDDIDRGAFEFDPNQEDIHMNVEAALRERIGEVAGKLHTARSRNDQVALDLRLYVKTSIQRIGSLNSAFQRTLLDQAEAHFDAIMPGYTHTQRAQPILFAHYLLAYFEMLERDKDRLRDAARRTDEMPLGSGALAGTTFPIDREMVARELGFGRVTRNSLDGVADRDFAIELIAAASLTMMHLSRLAQEIVLWSSPEFGFVALPEDVPEPAQLPIAELIRGKTGRVYGDLLGLLSVMKSLPLAYNKDLQEDKEGLFDAIDTVELSLRLIDSAVRSLKVDPNRMKSSAGGGFATATDLADYLARRGLPFREAHEVVGRLVRYCIDRRIDLYALTREVFQQFSPLFDDSVFTVITVEHSVAARDVIGGTAPNRVRVALTEARQRLESPLEKPLESPDGD